MAEISVALAYLNGNINELSTGSYELVVKEPRSHKDKNTGDYVKTHDNKYKLFVPKHKMPPILLEYGSYEYRKKQGVSISIAFTGDLEGILTNIAGNGYKLDDRVTQAQGVVKMYSNSHGLFFVRAMVNKNTYNDREDNENNFPEGF